MALKPLTAEPTALFNMAAPTLPAYDVRIRLANKSWMDPVLPGLMAVRPPGRAYLL